VKPREAYMRNQSTASEAPQAVPTPQAVPAPQAVPRVQAPPPSTVTRPVASAAAGPPAPSHSEFGFEH
jgi:hypothetical protein